MKHLKILKKIQHYLHQAFPLFVMFVFILIFLRFSKQISVKNFLEYTVENYYLAAISLLIMYAIKSLTIVFPLTLLYLISGIIFSPSLAILINIMGTAITVTIPYWIGWYSGNNLTQKLLRKYPKAQQLHEIQKNNDWFFSYLLRIIGILPYDVISLYIGSLRMPYPTYLSGSMLGMIPNILIMTLVGINITDPNSPVFISAIIFRVLLTICSVAIYRIVLKLRKNEHNQ